MSEITIEMQEKVARWAGFTKVAEPFLDYQRARFIRWQYPNDAWMARLPDLTSLDNQKKWLWPKLLAKKLCISVVVYGTKSCQCSISSVELGIKAYHHWLMEGE